MELLKIIRKMYENKVMRRGMLLMHILLEVMIHNVCEKLMYTDIMWIIFYQFDKLIYLVFLNFLQVINAVTIISGLIVSMIINNFNDEIHRTDNQYLFSALVIGVILVIGALI